MGRSSGMLEMTVENSSNVRVLYTDCIPSVQRTFFWTISMFDNSRETADEVVVLSSAAAPELCWKVIDRWKAEPR